MAEIETNDDEVQARTQTTAHDKLVAWIVSRAGVEGRWSQFRDTNFKERWEKYYRLWRGIWAASDKDYKSERSKFISPALQQAIEAITSEIESALLDKPAVFDIEDDTFDQQDKDIEILRMSLREDMREGGFYLALAEIFLNGSIWGTGIGKLNLVEETKVEVEVGEDGELATVESKVTRVRLEPVLPQQFSIDTAAKNLKDALGFAHNYQAPRHMVIAGVDDGTYFDVPVEQAPPDDDAIDSDELQDTFADSVNMLDYRGKVPRQLLEMFEQDEDDTEVVDLFPDEEDEDDGPMDIDEDDLVEAMVLIVNESHILKANKNPNLFQDRMFVAYRHEIVPDQFWGRGAAEKGYNSQQALDGSMRARMDGLALTVRPMMGIDASSLPRGFKFAVRPGRTVMTNGRPSEILEPLNFGKMDPSIFTDNAELERMVTMATGGMDMGAPVNVNNRNETMGGMSMQLGMFVKRSKRTIRNIEEEMIIPMTQQTARLYMQHGDRERYPAKDYTFRAMSVLGTMAREMEQQQFAQMLNSVPETSPAFWMLMKSYYESSSLSNRETMVPMIEQMLEQAVNPPEPQPDPLIALKRMEIEGKIRNNAATMYVNLMRARAEVARAAHNARLAPSEEAKNEADAILKLAQAEAQEQGTQLDVYKAQLEALERDAAASQGVLENAVKSATELSAGQGPLGQAPGPNLPPGVGPPGLRP